MSKVNTLYNYFTSPKTPKTPKQSNNKQISDEKPTTPKRARGQLNKVKTPSKGKENKNLEDRKRIYKDDEEEEKEKSEPIQTKKRRLIIPDEESGEDSGDEFKPGLCLVRTYLIFFQK